MKSGESWWECKNPSGNVWNSRNQGDNVGNGVGMQQISVKLRGKLGKSVRKGAEMRNARSGEG